MLFYTVWWHI